MSEIARIMEMEALEDADNAELVAAENAEEEQEEKDIAVLDDASAEMLMHRIKEANDEYDRMESWYKTQLKRMKEKRDATVAWAEGCLRGYFEMVPKKETKTQQSYQLPSGKLVMKMPGPAFDHDDKTLIPWLKKNWPEYVKIEESVDWKELKKQLKVSGTGMVTEDGEVVPGVKVTPKQPEFHAEPN